MSVTIPGYTVEDLRFLVRGGTAANLAAVNETPFVRELVVERDTLKMKLGDGVTAYNSLPYIPTGESVALDLEFRVTSTGVEFRTSSDDPWTGVFLWSDVPSSGGGSESGKIPLVTGEVIAGQPVFVILEDGSLVTVET